MAETSPTGVSAPADTEVLASAETGTGADTSAVSVAVVSVTVVFTSVWLETVGLVSVACVTTLVGSVKICEVFTDAPVFVC